MGPGSWTSLLGTLACTMKQREGRRDMNITLLTLLLSEILPRGEPCKSCSFWRQRAVSGGDSCHPLSRGHSCAGGSARARGILHTQGCSLPSLQLVPLTAIWKYLSSCFGAKEQLAYTLLLLHDPPEPSCSPNSSLQSPVNGTTPSLLICFYCLPTSFPKSASALGKHPSP